MPIRKMRMAGILWLVVIFCGVFAELLVRSQLIVGGDPSATFRRIAQSETLYRSGIVAELIAALSYAGVSLFLYDILRPVRQDAARAAAAFGLAGSAIMAANLVTLALPLTLIATLGSASSGDADMLVATSLRLHSWGYNFAICFFTVQIALLATLVAQSRFIPRTIAVLLAIEAACSFANIFGGFLAPEVARHLYPYILMPSLVAEGGFALWLLFNRKAAGDQTRDIRPRTRQQRQEPVDEPG